MLADDIAAIETDGQTRSRIEDFGIALAIWLYVGKISNVRLGSERTNYRR
ncbi:hypothetical protein [Thioclava sp. GXIMD2076]